MDPRDPTAPEPAGGYLPARTRDPGDPAFAGIAPSGAGGSDDALLAILRVQGFAGLPAPVSSLALGGLVARGWQELWRGVAEADDGTSGYQIMTAFARSELTYVGQGVFGNGHYFATDPMVGARYAGDDGRVIRAALNPIARIIDFEAVDDDRRIWRIGADREARELMLDVGRFAAASGYDAIRILDAGEHNVLVLNRTALAVEV